MGEQTKTAWIWQALIVLVLFAAALFVGHKTTQRVIIEYDTIIQVDTVRFAQIDTVLIPYRVIENDTIYIYDTLKFEVPVFTDTSGIIDDYFRHYIYYDTLYHENIAIRLEEVIHRNRLDYRSVRYTDLKETKTVTATPHERGYYIGADATAMAIKPELTYYRDGWSFSVGYDIQFRDHNSLSIGIKKKL